MKKDALNVDFEHLEEKKASDKAALYRHVKLEVGMRKILVSIAGLFLAMSSAWAESSITSNAMKCMALYEVVSISEELTSDQAAIVVGNMELMMTVYNEKSPANTNTGDRFFIARDIALRSINALSMTDRGAITQMLIDCEAWRERIYAEVVKASVANQANAFETIPNLTEGMVIKKGAFGATELELVIDDALYKLAQAIEVQG